MAKDALPVHPLGQDAAELDRVQLHLRAACPGGEKITRGPYSASLNALVPAGAIGGLGPVTGPQFAKAAANLRFSTAVIISLAIANRRDYVRETRWTFLDHGPPGV